MQLIEAAKSFISSEINQRKILQKNLLLKSLSSKRLLADHVEIIEDSFNDFLKGDVSPTNYITFLTTSGVLATSYSAFVYSKHNSRYLIPVVSGVMSILYIQKLVNVRNRKSLESKFTKLISTLDSYESAIKKNKALLHEARVVKSSASILKRYDKDNQIPQNLVQSIKNVINALYSLVKDLETFSIAEKSALVYEPFEDLQHCSLITKELEQEIDSKVIKDFFNIFAYVQSQVLMRFALIAASNVDDCQLILKTKIDCVTEMLRAETANISKFLDIINSVSQLQDNIQKLIDHEISLTMPQELREVRRGSIQFSAKILNVALQCQHLEESIVKFAEKFEHPSQKEVEAILEMMRNVDNNLSLSIDEHKRVAISFQKYLNMETKDEKVAQDKPAAVDSGDHENVKKVTEDDVMDQSDDFFFVDGSNVEVDEEVKAEQPETIDEVNSKLAKKYFKPVLVQLKERIEVIGEDMKERERKVLKAKGIEVGNEPELARTLSEEEHDSGSDDERERKRKFKRNEEKFSENREFLESKQPINFFKLPPRAQALDEDVLE